MVWKYHIVDTVSLSMYALPLIYKSVCGGRSRDVHTLCVRHLCILNARMFVCVHEVAHLTVCTSEYVCYA
jgi:hypothetical protein